MVVSRRVVQAVLGAIWFIDGLLQLKPQMFTEAFVQQVILPTADSQPGWVAALVNWGGNLVLPHIVWWNLAFALIQLFLGIALMFNYRPKLAIALSFVWCAIVWIFAEGFGELLSGQAMLLTGAPGAVLLYAFAGIAVCPQSEGPSAAWRPGGIRFAQVSLGILWIAGFVMHLLPGNLQSGSLPQAISVPWVASLVAGNSVVVSVVVGLLELFVGILLVARRQLRIAVWATAGLSLLFWWFGQSFGQVFDPLSTDLNSAPLMILLAICASPAAWISLKRGHSSIKSL